MADATTDTGRAERERSLLVFQTDFGREEGTVAQMYGVALKVDPGLTIHEISHEIPRFNTWEASYRLFQTLASWPEGTVFVSVIDPGVGSTRKSVVARTKSGHYIVTPDNGSLTHVAERFGITALREIDEDVERAPGSEHSHTFHGRDVYGYNGARLASGEVKFEEIGRKLDPDSIVCHPIRSPRIEEHGDESLSEGETKPGENRIVAGMIEIIDVHFGNVWTNIPLSLFEDAGFVIGDRLHVLIRKGNEVIFERELPYARSFSAVDISEPLAYTNELLYMALSLNQGNFADTYGISYGPEWTVQFDKVSKP
jgi:S-adenosylmethionine hydrolase